MKFSKSGHHPDYVLLSLIAVLTAAGLMILSSASSELGKVRFDDSYYYLAHQMQSGLITGLAGFFVALFLHYQKYRRLAVFALFDVRQFVNHNHT